MIEKSKFSSSIGSICVAINFATKYRHAIFQNTQVKKRCEEIIREVENVYRDKYGIKILEIGIDTDHIHILITFGVNISLSKVVQLIKGRSSFFLFKEFPYLRERYFWGGHLWSPAYYFDSTGNAGFEHHSEYIQKQGEERNQLTLNSFIS